MRIVFFRLKNILYVPLPLTGGGGVRTLRLRIAPVLRYSYRISLLLGNYFITDRKGQKLSAEI